MRCRANLPGFQRDAGHKPNAASPFSLIADVGLQRWRANGQKKQAPTRLTDEGAQRRGLRWTVGIGLSPNPHPLKRA
jgi:hypothetical protein